jgi:hypothetical protein
MSISCSDSPSAAEEAKLIGRSSRGIRRLVTLCGTVTQLVAEYDRRLLRSNNGDDDDDDDDDIDEEDLDEDKAPTPETRDEIKR